MNLKAHWLKLSNQKGFELAFYQLLDSFVGDREREDKRSQSRFYRWAPATESTVPGWHRMTEDQVSYAFDLGEDQGTENIHWLGDDGAFHKVTAIDPGSKMTLGGLDEFYAENPTTVFTWYGDLIANGIKVGTVRFTDH